MDAEWRATRSSLRLLLEHLGRVEDPREPAKVTYPLREVLFLVTCTTVAGCDEYDEIKEDLSRLRRGHGAHNMALVRRFAFNIVRTGRGKHAIKTTRKAAGWQTAVLNELVRPSC